MILKSEDITTGSKDYRIQKSSNVVEKMDYIPLIVYIPLLIKIENLYKCRDKNLNRAFIYNSLLEAICPVENFRVQVSYTHTSIYRGNIVPSNFRGHMYESMLYSFHRNEGDTFMVVIKKAFIRDFLLSYIEQIENESIVFNDEWFIVLYENKVISKVKKMLDKYGIYHLKRKGVDNLESFFKERPIKVPSNLIALDKFIEDAVIKIINA